MVQREVTAEVTSAILIPHSIGVAVVPYSIVSSFSGNCSRFFLFPFFLLCLCVCLCVVVTEGGGEEEKRVGLSMSSVTL